MYEFEAVSVSSYEAGSLAAKLTERSAAGWDVVAIVPTGSDVTAYLKKGGRGTTSSTESSASSSPSSTSVVSEPSGWGKAPTSSGDSAGASGGWGSTSSSATPGSTGTSTGGWGASSGSSSGWGGGSASTPASAPTQVAATPAVPAGWYADPAGRYELRYWDGSSWTEHVSRAGQQYTDPPVA